MTIRTASLIAAAVGFISLSCEILWFRVYSYLTGGSPVTFGLLLGIYLAGLAVGAEIGGIVSRGSDSSPLAARNFRLAAYIYVANTLAFFAVPVMGFAATSPARGGLALLAVMIAACGFGFLLPALSHMAVPPTDRAGQGLSFVYSANIAGSVCGSLVTGFILMEYMTTTRIVLSLAFAGYVLAAFTIVSESGINRWLGLSLAGASALASVVAAPRLTDGLYEKLQFKDAYHGQRFAHIVENRHGVIATTDSAATFGGGVYDGHVSTSLTHDPNVIERAYAISLLHPNPRSVLMIGLSTGAWAQVIASSPLVDSLRIIEINPGYLQLIRQYPQVASVLRNPKVRITIDDGRRWLVHQNRQFDLIVSNTTFHYRSNSTNLLSIEFMRLVHQHLRPGGVFYFNTTGSQDAMKTAFTEFRHGLRVVNFIAVSDSAFRLDPVRWGRLLEDYRIDGKPVFDVQDSASRDRVQRIAELPATLSQPPSSRGLESRESVLARIPLSRVVTDDNMLPEWRTLILRSSPTPQR